MLTFRRWLGLANASTVYLNQSANSKHMRVRMIAMPMSTVTRTAIFVPSNTRVL